MSYLSRHGDLDYMFGGSIGSTDEERTSRSYDRDIEIAEDHLRNAEWKKKEGTVLVDVKYVYEIDRAATAEELFGCGMIDSIRSIMPVESFPTTSNLYITDVVHSSIRNVPWSPISPEEEKYMYKTIDEDILHQLLKVLPDTYKRSVSRNSVFRKKVGCIINIVAHILRGSIWVIDKDPGYNFCKYWDLQHSKLSDSVGYIDEEIRFKRWDTLFEGYCHFLVNNCKKNSVESYIQFLVAEFDLAARVKEEAAWEALTQKERDAITAAEEAAEEAERLAEEEAERKAAEEEAREAKLAAAKAELEAEKARVAAEAQRIAEERAAKEAAKLEAERKAAEDLAAEKAAWEALPQEEKDAIATAKEAEAKAARDAAEAALALIAAQRRADQAERRQAELAAVEKDSCTFTNDYNLTVGTGNPLAGLGDLLSTAPSKKKKNSKKKRKGKGKIKKAQSKIDNTTPVFDMSDLTAKFNK